MPSETSSTTTQSSTSHAPSRLGDAAGDVLDQAGRTAERGASTAMIRAGDTLDQVARAVRDSGDQLRTDRPEIATVADTAAERVEGIAAYLREHDAREILDEAERLARRQPALVVGGGLLLGLIAGRLLRSGAEPTNGNGSSRYWSGGAGSSSGGSYRGGSGWSGGSSSDVSSSRPAGTTTPASGYGTGYGASYDPTVDSVPDTAARNLAATDAAATDGTSGASTSRSTASRSTSKRRGSSTGES